jgi:hypothetical protein
MSKWLVRVAILIISILTLGVLTWYSLFFYPHLEKLNQLINEGNNSISNVSPKLYSFAVAAESKKGIRVYGMKQAFHSLVWSKERGSNISWHGNNILWLLASYIHFNEKEIFAIWVNCSISGCGKGLNAAAVKYYNKELHALNEQELLGLVVLVRSPQRFIPRSKQSEERIKKIMNKKEMLPFSGLK